MWINQLTGLGHQLIQVCVVEASCPEAPTAYMHDCFIRKLTIVV